MCWLCGGVQREGRTEGECVSVSLPVLVVRPAVPVWVWYVCVCVCLTMSWDVDGLGASDDGAWSPLVGVLFDVGKEVMEKS